MRNKNVLFIFVSLTPAFVSCLILHFEKFIFRWLFFLRSFLRLMWLCAKRFRIEMQYFIRKSALTTANIPFRIEAHFVVGNIFVCASSKCSSAVFDFCTQTAEITIWVYNCSFARAECGTNVITCKQFVRWSLYFAYDMAKLKKAEFFSFNIYLNHSQKNMLSNLIKKIVRKAF